MTEAMLIVVHPSPLLKWDKMSALNATECNWHLRCNVKGEKAWKAQSLDPPTLGGPELAGELFSKEQKGAPHWQCHCRQERRETLIAI